MNLKNYVWEVWFFWIRARLDDNSTGKDCFSSLHDIWQKRMAVSVRRFRVRETFSAHRRLPY